MEDNQLIHGILSKDPEVLEYLVKNHQDKIYRLCLQYVHNDEEAQDIVQEVFITVIEKIENFRGESKFSTWLYSVTVFTAIGYLRKKQRKKESSFDELTLNNQEKEVSQKDVLSNDPLPEDSTLQKEARMILYQAIDELPLDYKTVFILKELEGLSIKEIQQSVPLSEPAIKTRLHRARLHLRSKLSGYFPEYHSDGN